MLIYFSSCAAWLVGGLSWSQGPEQLLCDSNESFNETMDKEMEPGRGLDGLLGGCVKKSWRKNMFELLHNTPAGLQTNQTV